MKILVERVKDGYVAQSNGWTIKANEDTVSYNYQDGTTFDVACSSLSDAFEVMCDALQAYHDDLTRIAIDIADDDYLVIRRGKAYWYWSHGSRLSEVTFDTAGEAAYDGIRQVVL